MINKELFEFLRELKKNNYKEWFHENKMTYQSIKKEYEQFIAQIIAEISLFDKSIGNIEPKNCIFRINRDIRFSNDKSPYKTNFGAFIVQGGRNSGNAGYYIHLEPDNCFLSGGIYMPAADKLKAVRTDIYENTNDFIKILNASDFKNHFNTITAENKLKTAPKGFPKDFKYIDLLRHKDYTVIKPIKESLAISNKFIHEIKVVFKAMQPFNSFINEAINYHLNYK